MGSGRGIPDTEKWKEQIMNEFPDYLKSFPREEYEAHIKKLQEEMEAEGLDMLLLS